MNLILKFNMKPKFFFILTAALFLLSTTLVSFGAYRWLAKPNNFFYIKESTGEWTTSKISHYRATGFNVKINAECAKSAYEEIEKQAKEAARETPDENTLRDFNRFQNNKQSDVSFETSEINYTSRFKWFQDNYITYDDPSLRSGIRFSFGNKCLYEKECSIADSLDYLWIKIGIKYFMKPAHAEFLKNNCIKNERVYFNIKNKYNFGRSDTYYRNGIGIWLGLWYNILGVTVILLSAGVLGYLLFRKKNRGSN